MSASPRRTTVELSLRVTPEAKRASVDRARRAGMTMSALITHLLLSEDVTVTGRPAAEATSEALLLARIYTWIKYYRYRESSIAPHMVRALQELRDDLVDTLRKLEPAYDEQLDALQKNEDWQLAETRK